MENKEILKLCKKHGLNITNIKKADNSYNSNVYIIYDNNTKYILKITKNEKKRINEKKYYNYLYNYVPTSKVLYSGVYNGKQYNIISFLEGKNVYDEECNNLTKEEIFNIGKLLGKIHSCKIIDEDSDSWIIYLKDCLNKTYLELNELFGKEDNDCINNFLNEYINKKIVNNYKNCLLHMDFRVGNVIIDENINVGIIDLESMKNGEYVFDFVKVNRIFNKNNFNIFLKGYKSERKIENDFSDKLKFYSFFDSYTSLYWCYTNKQIESDFYKLNYKIVIKFLGKIKDGKWII